MLDFCDGNSQLLKKKKKYIYLNRGEKDPPDKDTLFAGIEYSVIWNRILTVTWYVFSPDQLIVRVKSAKVSIGIIRYGPHSVKFNTFHRWVVEEDAVTTWEPFSPNQLFVRAIQVQYISQMGR